MYPIIFSVNKTPLDVDNIQYMYSNYPSPSLIKYGFNTIENELNILKLTSNENYANALEYGFANNNKSTIEMGNNTFKIKNFDKEFAESYEISKLFNLIKNNSKIGTNVHSFNNVLKSLKIDATVNELNKKNKIDLLFLRFSDIDLDENSLIHLLIDNLISNCNNISVGGNIVCQLFSCQTDISAQLITFLASKFEECYLVKPMIVSNLSDCKYIVLKNLLNTIKLPNSTSNSDSKFINSINVKVLPSIADTIQCMNSVIFPKKIERYNIILSYLDSKVYEGATYQDFIDDQLLNITKWIETYNGNVDMNKIIDESIKIFSNNCVIEKPLDSFY